MWDVMLNDSHPQIIFTGESLQELLVMSILHLPQQSQKTRHKLALKHTVPFSFTRTFEQNLHTDQIPKFTRF